MSFICHHLTSLKIIYLINNLKTLENLFLIIHPVFVIEFDFSSKDQILLKKYLEVFLLIVH